MSDLGKPFPKKSHKKTENQRQNAACEQETTSKKEKFSSIKKTRPRLNYEWNGKTIQKKSSQRNLKKSENQVEMAACEQKTASEKAIFCSNIVLPLYFKMRVKNFAPENHSLFRSTSCFGVTKTTTPI